MKTQKMLSDEYDEILWNLEEALRRGKLSWLYCVAFTEATVWVDQHPEYDTRLHILKQLGNNYHRLSR